MNMQLLAGRDHPRRCGENLNTVLKAKPISGSPPQVRGKHSVRVLLQQRVGITSAGAGKTADRRLGRVRAQDHPRRCGENRLRFLPARPPRGSPPQVRGKRFSSHASCFLHRITPAGAGKTLYIARGDFERGDHPRRCGENCSKLIVVVSRPGSPPQVRGKRERQKL